MGLGLPLGLAVFAWPAPADPCLTAVEPAATVTIDHPGFFAASVTTVDRDAPLQITVRPQGGGPCVLVLDHEGGGWLEAGDYDVEIVALDGGQPSLGLQLAHTSTAALEARGVSPPLARAALLATDSAWTDGLASRLRLTIANYGLPSDEERLWLVNLRTGFVDDPLFVSHGKGSGGSDRRDAVRFSNTPHSNQTSLGLMRGAETYIGSHGRSLRLDGLEPALNDLARPRAIVVHGAEYARVEHIGEWGYLGRSFGCPSVDDRIANVVIDAIADGGLFFAWHPDLRWDELSTFAWTPPPSAEPSLPPTDPPLVH